MDAALLGLVFQQAETESVPRGFLIYPWNTMRSMDLINPIPLLFGRMQFHLMNEKLPQEIPVQSRINSKYQKFLIVIPNMNQCLRKQIPTKKTKGIIHPPHSRIIILPYKERIDAESLEWYLNANRQNITCEAKRAMFKKGISSADQLDYDLNYFSTCVNDFQKIPNVCFTSAISYQIKATSFLNCGDPISPVVHPFDLKIMKLKGKPEKRQYEKERAHQLLQDLIFDPRKYFSGELFEIDLRHKLFLKEYQKLTNWTEEELLDLRTEAIRYIENGNYDRLGEMAIAIRNCASTTNKYTIKETI